MNKVYYLKSCSTCIRILKELELPKNVVLQNIKTEAITEIQIDEMKRLAASYEGLFSKRATLYKQRDLKNKSLTETDYKNLILEHYTFLSRPVFIIDHKIYIGNSKQNVEAVKIALNEN
ncbi:arsenate reductase family protein [Lacinutrix jangbogonensis]|uniref:arsenate reductase family protein n=1 Tax=Lacinutrix jangbogonensis TaxID=1469557 RepID=UPI00053EB031|nr:ArsC/Spx/MgsR family protein [Lacinutrix jangbogonensis]